MSDNNNVSKTGSFVLPKIRKLVQLAMLAVYGKWAFYGIFRCPFLVPFVNCESCPVITCWGRYTAYFFGFWLLLPLSAILVGRAFCGWICPTGFINQLLGKVAPFKLRVQKPILKYAQIGMVISLALVAYIYIGLDNPRFMVPIRGGDFFNSIQLSFVHAFQPWLIRSFIVIGFIAASIIVANVWCRFVCPMGGFLELIRHISLFGVIKTKDCDNCNACLKKCEMGTRPGEMNCTNCGECLHTCHKDAIKFGQKGNYDE